MDKDDEERPQRHLLWRTNLSAEALAALVERHPRTVYGWWRGRPMPAAVRRLCEILGGEMPWPGFEGWHAAAGGLVYPPGARDPVPIAEATVAQYAQRRAELLERELAELRRVPAQYLFDWDEPS